MSSPSASAETQTVTFAYGDTQVTVPFVSLEPEPTPKSSVHVIYFTGFGEQDDLSLTRSAEAFAAHGLRVTSVGIPFHRHSLEVAEWLLNTGVSELINQLATNSSPLVLAGDSRGAAVAASAATNTDCAMLLLLAPLGLTDMSGRTYLGRLIKNMLANNTYLELETYTTSAHILDELSGHLHNGGIPQALRFAMRQQERTRQGIRTLYESGKNVAIFVGEHDLVFPKNESLQALTTLVGKDSAASMLHTVPRGHAAIASPTGRLQLQTIAAWLVNSLDKKQI